MSGAAIITTSDAESVEPAVSHGNSHVTSQLLPVMLDHLTYKDNEFNSDGDGSDDDDNDDDDDDHDDDGDGTTADGVSQVAMVISTTSVVLSTASLTSSLPEQALSTTTNSSHSMTV